MKHRYYSLLIHSNGAWGVEFGDYDREEVEAERDSYLDGNTGERTRIIRTSDQQADIDAAVAELNR